MKLFLISDNTETLLGMRFAGVEGVVVHEQSDAVEAIKKAAADRDCAVIMITPKLKKLCDGFLGDFMEKHPLPLVIEIPDRHSCRSDFSSDADEADFGEANRSGSIFDFIQHSIGLKLGESKGGK